MAGLSQAERQGNILYITTVSHWKKTRDKRDNIQEFLQGSVGIEDVLFRFPLTPADMMFKEGSNAQSVDLLNYGEYPVSMNAQLATWTITGVFPTVRNAEAMPSYVLRKI